MLDIIMIVAAILLLIIYLITLARFHSIKYDFEQSLEILKARNEAHIKKLCEFMELKEINIDGEIYKVTDNNLSEIKHIAKEYKEGMHIYDYVNPKTVYEYSKDGAINIVTKSHYEEDDE